MLRPKPFAGGGLLFQATLPSPIEALLAVNLRSQRFRESSDYLGSLRLRPGGDELIRFIVKLNWQTIACVEVGIPTLSTSLPQHRMMLVKKINDDPGSL